ncbi:TonB-dependent receptor [Algivirga pacifica]|uniref:TonB-dependent receptor n=1 Tax=Algivirga pacifica TaxID=1162670 RepID=A0ABP9DGE4_9BACT
MRLKAVMLGVFLGLWGISQAQRHTIHQDTIATSVLQEVVVEGEGAQDFYIPEKQSSLERIMDRTSSVNLIKRGNYAQEPVIQGLSAGQINITVDGMHVFGACTDRMDPVSSYVETNNLSALQIEEGANGNIHGSTIGGALNMVSPAPVVKSEQPWSGGLGATYHSVSNGQDYLGNLNYAAGKWGVRYSGGWRKHQNYLHGKGKQVDFSQYTKMNHSLNLRYLLNESSALRLSLIMDDARDVGYPALPMDVSSAKGNLYGLTYEWYPEQGSLHHLQAKIYGNNITHIMDDSKRPDVPIRMDMPGWSDTYGGFVETMWQWGRHQLMLKTDVYTNDVRAEMTMYPNQEGGIPMFMLTWADTRRTVGGVYARQSTQWTTQWKTNISLRMDYAHTLMTSTFGKQQFQTLGYAIEGADERLLVSPQLEVHYQPSEQWKFSMQGAYTSRQPTITEIYGFYLFNRFDGYDYVGSPDIKNEKAWQWSAKASHETEQLQLGVSTFAYLFRDYIMGVTDPSLNRMTVGAKGVKRYTNIPSAYMVGANANAHWWLTKDLSTKTTLQYTHGRLEDGDGLPMMLPLRWQQALRYQYKQWQLQAEYEYANQQNEISEVFEEQATEAYYLVNLRAEYEVEWQGKRGHIQVGVDNLLDAYYRTHLDWGGIYRPGRDIYVGMNIIF